MGGTVLIIMILLLLALLATAIAILKRMASTQRHLRRVQLFSPRFALFQATKDVLEAALVRKDWSEETASHYLHDISAAPFLVNANLAADLTSFAQAIGKVRGLRAELDSATALDQRLEISSRLSEQMAAISDFASHLENRFKPYLDVLDPVI